ncbi:unnamed protein product [Caenorhabditis nigoni]
MDQFLNIEKSRFEPIGWGPEDLQTRNTIYYLIQATGAWEKKGRVPRNDFNNVSRLLYCRTEKLISGKSCLEVWIQGRKQLREMLRKSIEEMKLEPMETEIHLIQTQPSYAYLAFARELFHEYEIELRVKFLGDGVDVDEELIKRVEEEDDIQFEDEEESDANPMVAPALQQEGQDAGDMARMEENNPEEVMDTLDLAGLDLSAPESHPPTHGDIVPPADSEEAMETSGSPGHAPQAHQQLNEVEYSAPPDSLSPAHQEYEEASQDAPFEYDEDSHQDHREDDIAEQLFKSDSDGEDEEDEEVEEVEEEVEDEEEYDDKEEVEDEEEYDDEEEIEDEEEEDDKEEVKDEEEEEKHCDQDLEDSHEEDRARANFITLRFRRFLKKNPKLVDDQMFNEIYAMALTGSTVSGSMKKRFANSALTGRHIELYGRMNQNQVRDAPGFVKDPIQREDPTKVLPKTLEQYKQKLKETRKELKNRKEKFLNSSHITILFECIHRTSDVWRTRKTSVTACDWEIVGKKLYERTDQAYSVNRMRKTWRDAKTKMFETLEKNKDKCPVEREEEMWKCYRHLLWYRIYKDSEADLLPHKEEEQEAPQKPKRWVKGFEINEKFEFEAYRRGDNKPEHLPHFPAIPGHMRFKNEELQTAQAMEYPEEFDENDRILRDTILQSLLKCQQEEKVLIQRTFLFYLGALGKGLNGPPSFRFDQLRKNVIE